MPAKKRPIQEPPAPARSLPYPYVPIIERQPLIWPYEARVAVWVIINVEHYEYDLPAPLPPPSPDRPVPDVRNFAWLEYGPRVGIWRLMDMLDRQGIRATVALNSAVCQHYPAIVAEGKKRGWEFMGHGITNSRSLRGLSVEAEREVIKETVQTISKAVGQRPRGWLSPGLTENFHTLDLLAEAGIGYVADWCNDDEPYPMKVGGKTIYSVPYTVELNDMGSFLTFHMSPEQFHQNIVDQFDVLYEEGAQRGKVMAIALHPFLTGQPYRARHLELALGYIRHHKRVWLATGGEIMDWYRRQRR